MEEKERRARPPGGEKVQRKLVEFTWGKMGQFPDAQKHWTENGEQN
jgi:hypothetical protein